MTAAAHLTLHIEPHLGAINAAQWDECAQAPAHIIASNNIETHNPFLSYAFLSSLEESGAVSAATGWAGAHLLVKNAQNKIMAACPTYVKSHSMGEYVFDHAWADAWERAGGNYYPKVQVCVPFTPVTGPRLLIHADAERSTAAQALIMGLHQIRDRCEASSIHITFPTQDDWTTLSQADFLPRTGKQFHFINHGYRDFDDFLSRLAARKRKMIKRERKDALSAGIEIEQLTGSAITETHWDAFYEFYMDTGARKWGRPYLNRAFFSLIGARMSERILLVMAKRAGRYIAGAINFIGDRHLYGRNWGCIEHHPFLHFEVCYYQAIDFALAHDLARVEAGAQGEHKLMRGYEPVETYSAHFIHDASFARAVKHFLNQERAQINAEIDLYAAHLPFKKTEG